MNWERIFNICMDTPIGKRYGTMSVKKQDNILDGFLDILCENHFGKQTFICSGLVAYCLQRIPNWKYNSSGVLKRKFGGINPNELLYDDKIFDPFEIN